jgi:pectate lyase
MSFHPGSPTWRRRSRVGLATATTTAFLTGVLVVAQSASAASLFTDNFEDANASGWSKSGGSWSVVTDGSYVYKQSGASAEAKAFSGQSTWTNYAAQARVKPLAYAAADRYVGVIARQQGSSSYYLLSLRSGGQVELKKVAGGQATTLGSGTVTVTAGAWYTLRLEAFGSSLRGFVNGTPVASATDSSYSTGRLGLITSYASAEFDDVVADSTATPEGGPTSPTPTVSPTRTTPPASDCSTRPVIIGFASVNAWGQNGTTGGCGGATVTVSNATDFLTAIARPESLIIKVNGMITLPGPMHDVTSNKTIVGIGASSGFTGGGLNIGLPIDNTVVTPPANAVHNVIIQNLVFTKATDDSINVQSFSHHIWIDHNDLSYGYDGLIDIKRGSSFVTVSWNHNHHHTKNMLLGHDDNNGAQDIGNLKVTYHHNFFDRTPQRNPRVRFGEPVHVFNNYYLYNTDVGVACQLNSGCVVEGNAFEDTEVAYQIDYAGDKGRMIARNNVFIGESLPGTIGGTVQEPSVYYSYKVDDPNTVKATVLAGAGTGHI